MRKKKGLLSRVSYQFDIYIIFIITAEVMKNLQILKGIHRICFKTLNTEIFISF